MSMSSDLQDELKGLDMIDRSAIYAREIMVGRICPNDVREHEGMSRIPEGEAAYVLTGVL